MAWLIILTAGIAVYYWWTMYKSGGAGSTNFSERAFLRGSGVSQIPAMLRPNMERLFQLAEQVRAVIGVPMAEVSGYRPPEVNANGNPGRAEYSQHMVANALDFRPIGMSAPAAYALIVAAYNSGRLPTLGYCHVYDEGFIHIDCGPRSKNERVAYVVSTLEKMESVSGNA